ncbi:TPA: hypothetical protein QDZ34_001088 [Stenotrophomonas maltophilia]|nr:hypothetical protein [Stenotrophomonas maltophilia]HDS1025459.1 hypothetical protein [Stenotrophomonas maltophilia]HDS1029132.1 hypothetical protein [Stenotrophomonas maltophilia]HDS1033764.1 hypothetical protein [Stenotrophomonas maltophilia]
MERLQIELIWCSKPQLTGARARQQQAQAQTGLQRAAIPSNSALQAKPQELVPVTGGFSAATSSESEAALSFSPGALIKAKRSSSLKQVMIFWDTGRARRRSIRANTSSPHTNIEQLSVPGRNQLNALRWPTTKNAPLRERFS